MQSVEIDEDCEGALKHGIAAPRCTPVFHAETRRAFPLCRNKQMYGLWRSDLACRRGELSATTSKHRALAVITQGQRSANYTLVVHLADKRRNNSLFSNTWAAVLPSEECLMNKPLYDVRQKAETNKNVQWKGWKERTDSAKGEKRWPDIMKCENSVRETRVVLQKLGQCVEQQGIRREGWGRERGRWRRCEGRRGTRRREVRRDVEMGGGGGREGGEMSPQCSAVSASSAGGAGRVPSLPLSPTHTDTHASLYNGCFTLVPERERARQRERVSEQGRHGEKTQRERHEGGWEKKETAMRYREKKSLWD